MKDKLFCEISPLTFRIAVQKNIAVRNIKNIFGKEKFSNRKSDEKLPFLIMEHKSVIRRALRNVDMTLQENKAKNLALAAPKIDGILIFPGETFEKVEVCASIRRVFHDDCVKCEKFFFNKSFTRT